MSASIDLESADERSRQASSSGLAPLPVRSWEYALSAEGRAEFWQSGVLVLPRLLSDADIEAIAGGLHEQLDSFKLDEPAAWGRGMQPLLERLSAMDQATPGSAALLHNAGHITRPLVERAMARAELIEVVANLLDTKDVDAHPVWNYRAQVANALRNNWHQDACFWPPAAQQQPIVAAWVPLVDVDLNSGGLRYLPHGHVLSSADGETTYGLWRHVYGSNAMSMDEEALDRIAAHGHQPQALAVERGAVALFHQLSIHGPTTHCRPRPRVSLDFRFLPGSAHHHLDAIEAPGRPLMRDHKILEVDYEDWFSTSYSTDRKRRGMCGTCGSFYTKYPEDLLGPLPAQPARWNPDVASEPIPLVQEVGLFTESASSSSTAAAA